MLQQFDERNRDLLVNINGELIHRDKAGISPFDSAVQGGDAVWEGLRLSDGRIFKLREHLDRLRSSALALAFESIPSHDTIVEEIKKTLAANDMRDHVHIRLTLTRGVKITSGMDPRLNRSGPTLIVLAEFKAPVYDKDGLTLITSSVRRFPPDCLDPKIHHCNLIQSILAKIEANAAGVDDALMLDMRGFVAETNATHVFIAENGVSDRVQAVAGDFTADPFPGDVDVVVMASNLPMYGPDVIQKVVGKAYDVWRPGGGMHLIGETLNDDRRGPVSAAFWGLGQALPETMGIAHSEADCVGYFETAGFRGIAVQPFVEGVLKRVGQRLEFDYAYCKGCGVCVAECPRNVIFMSHL